MQPKSKVFKSLTHKDFENRIRKERSISSPNFFVIDELSNEHIGKHNKKIE